MIWVWILGILVVLLLVVTIYYYNRFIVLENNIGNAYSQIDVQLKKRNDLIPNLVEIVKGYAKHEKSVFTELAKARKEMLQAKTLDAKLKASDKISEALKTVFALAENYPELKANQNFLQLQEELSDVESKIAFTRQYFNDAVLVYNNAVTTFPGVIFAKLFGKQPKDYLKAKPVERENVKISF